jgi:hypothetical protein
MRPAGRKRLGIEREELFRETKTTGKIQQCDRRPALFGDENWCLR